MTFDGINYLAVLVAAAAAGLLAILWYQILIKQWLAREGKSETQLGPRNEPKGYVLFVLVVQLIMARILADVVAHTGSVTLDNGIMWAGLCFLGFIGPVMVNNSYLHGRRGMLGVIELGYWFVALALMGTIIGAFGAY